MPHNRVNHQHPAIDRHSLKEEEAEFRAELAQSEREWLHDQIRSLQQALQYQMQECQEADRQLELINQELQQVLQAMPPSSVEAKEFAEMLLAEQLPAIEAIAKLLSFIYGETIELTEPEPIHPLACLKQLDTILSLRGECANTLIHAKVLKEQLVKQRAVFRAQIARMKSQCGELSCGIERSRRFFSERMVESVE